MTVAVYGAGGHTGRFVVTELLRRGLPTVAVTRGGGAVPAEVETRVAATTDPAALRAAFAGSKVVINCAGPFLDTADALVAAAVNRGCHYLDVTAEAASAGGTLDRWSAPAAGAGVTVLPAVAFFGGLADLLATAASGAQADEIRIGIALDSWHPTAGTRATGRRNTARRMMIRRGRPEPVPEPAERVGWDFPEPFGRQDVVEISFSEVALIPRHLAPAELHTYLNEDPMADLRDPHTPAPQPDATGRSPQQFVVDAVTRSGSIHRRATARGRDIYAVTAPLVCEAAQRLLDGAGRPGAFAVAELLDARTVLKALTPDHLVVDLA